MRLNRGTLTEPGKNSPFRDRGIEENLDLFRRMGRRISNGARVRAKINMASGNINLRDPVLYRCTSRIRALVGRKIYPSYDFAHGQRRN
jgi:glutaminyl-tRNA synthetase